MVDLLALEDPVHAKKTQLGKDWQMIARLIERSYLTREQAPDRELIELAGMHAALARGIARTRTAVSAALARDPDRVAQALATEEADERRSDREYWQPLRLELEQLRHPQRDQKL